MTKTQPTNHEDRAHALMAPSSMSRTLRCPGHIAFCESLNLEDGEASEASTLGTSIHELGEKILRSRLSPQQELFGFDDGGIDPEVYECAEGYADYVMSTLLKYEEQKGKIISTHIEEKFKFSENIWGTPDFVAIGEDRLTGEKDLIIIDLKTGRIPVSPVDNDQLKTYAACVQADKGLVILNTYMFIYQPTVSRESREVASMGFAGLAMYKRQLIQAEAMVLDSYNTGDISAYMNAREEEGMVHCTYCPGKGDCPKYLDALNSSTASVVSTASSLPSVETISMETKANILKHSKAIKSFLDAVEKSLYVEMKNGVEVPGFKLVKANTKTKWKDDEKFVSKILKRNGVEPFRETLITIGDAKKALKKHLDKDTIEEMLNIITEKPEGGLTIAPEDDKRSEVPADQAVLDVMGVL